MKIISFYNPKGGVGKSTLNILLCNYIQYYLNKKVVFINAATQKGVEEKRTTDEYILERDGKQDILNRLYPIYSIASEDLYDILVEAKSSESNVDYMVVDLPGNYHQKGIISNLALVDYMFIPLQGGQLEIIDTKEFISYLQKEVTPIRKKYQLPDIDISICLNKVKAGSKELQFALDYFEQDTGVPLIKEYITDSQSNLQTKLNTYKVVKIPGSHKIHDFCISIMNKINL